MPVPFLHPRPAIPAAIETEIADSVSRLCNIECRLFRRPSVDGGLETNQPWTANQPEVKSRENVAQPVSHSSSDRSAFIGVTNVDFKSPEFDEITGTATLYKRQARG